MKIRALEIWPVAIPYKNTYASSRGQLKAGQGVILCLHTDEGLSGFGEASLLFPDRSGETQASMVHVLSDYFAPLLLGQNPLEIQVLMGRLERCAGDAFAFPYTRAAVDLALYDLMGKILNQPVAVLLGGVMRRTMKVGRSLSIKPLPELVSHAERLAQEGYYGLTLKGSSDWRGDQARFIALRKALGPDFPLEIDPNQAYAVADAIRLVKALEPYDLANLEQPCPWWDLDGLQRIQQASSVPVTADESVMCPSDALQIIKRQAASQITLKLARLGGILAAKKVLTVADAGGLTCNMGSKHPFGIGTAALLHFCAAHAQVVEPLGYGSPLERFVDDILDTPIPFAQGVVTLPEGVGLGVSVDRHKLKLYAPEGPILIS